MHINENQRVVMSFTLLAAILMLVFPPFHLAGSGGYSVSGGYHFIFSGGFYSVNIGLLLVQWIGVAMISGIAFILLKTDATEDDKTGVSGWLWIFCVCATIITPLLILGGLVNELDVINSTKTPWGESLNKTPYAFDAIFSIGIAIAFIAAGSKTWRRAEGAIKFVKVVLVANVVVQLICPYFFSVLFNTSYSTLAKLGGGQLVISLIWAGGWLLYLGFSERVKNTFPATHNNSLKADGPDGPRP